MLDVLAQAAGDADSESIWVTFAVSWGPVLLIAVLIYFFVFRMLRANAGKSEDYLGRLRTHMDKMEAEAARTRELLESIDRQLRDRP